MTYTWKRAAELAWFAGVAAALAVLQVLVTWEPDKIDDWRTWAVAVGGGAIRAAAGAIIAAATKPGA